MCHFVSCKYPEEVSGDACAVQRNAMSFPADVIAAVVAAVRDRRDAS